MSSNGVYSVSELYGRKVKPTNERFGTWLLAENVGNLITDIGNINYTEGEELLRETLRPITDPFCDNIMVVKLCGSEDCNGGSGLVKKEICGLFNSYLRGKFGDLVSARHGVKAKLPFFLYSDNQMAKGVREVLGESMDRITKKYDKPVCIPYKVELADVHVETLLKELPELIKQLQKEDYYLLDLDITQDFCGVFQKEEMTNYLTSNFNFRKHGMYRENCNVIVNNNNTVGIDCLTWLTSNARVKIYNKFICQLTSPGVNKCIGNHIIDFLNCPDKRLKETFSNTLAKEHGITRLEATIYNYSIADNRTGEYNCLDDCLTLLEDTKLYFQNAPLYSISFAKMWTKLSKSLQNSCCLVFNNILQYVYWGNSNTRKLTGLQINLPMEPNARKKVVNYCLSAFSFNFLPINYIEIVEDTSNKEKNVRISQKCYIKAGDTFFTRSCTLFSTIPEDIDTQELGLVSTCNIIPKVLRKRENKNSKLMPFALKEITAISPISMLSVKKRKLEMEETELKKRKKEYLENTATVKEEYKHFLEKEQKIAELKGRLEDYFYTRWKNLEPSGEYSVSAFTVNNKNTYTYVGVLADKDGQKDVYYIKGYHKNTFLRVYNNREALVVDGYVTLPYKNGMELICLPTEKPFVTFTTNGYTSFNDNTFAKIENLQFYTDAWKNVDVPFTQEEVERVNIVTMQEIADNTKFRDCQRLEEFAEGTELVIAGIKEVMHRGRLRYILKLDNINVLYLSNYWLEQELKEIDLDYRIKIKIDVLKHTPNRNKERVVFCV